MKRFLLILIVCWARLAFSQGSCSNFAGGSCPANIPSGVVHFYFIDPSSGSDSNSGASESAAWAHLPGMTGVTAGVGPGVIDNYAGTGTDNCGSSTCDFHAYGFIVRGGTTFTSASLPMFMREMGTSAAPLYFGVDPGWYSGGSWSRPIFNAGGSSANLCGNTATAATGSTCFGGNGLITFSPTGYVYWDNFEFTNLYWYASGVTNGQETYLNFARCNSTGNCVLEHNYAHGWAHHAYSSGANADVCNLFAGDTSVVDRTSIAEFNVVDGSDTAEDACVAFWGGPPFANNNYIHGVPNGAVVDSVISWSGNWFDTITTSYDTTQHQNTFEDNGAHNNEFFYNNVATNTTNSDGLTLNFAPCTGTTTYVFNNVEGNTDDTPLNVQPECGTGTLFVFNNTIELGADSVAGTGNSGVGTGTYPGCPTGLAGCTYRNNQFIGTNTQADQTCNATCTNTTDLSQTIAVAKANSSPAFNQYAFSQSPYIFSPTASTNSTVGAGTNTASVCTTISGLNSAAGTACSSDTNYGVTYNSTAHTVSAPARTVNSRPASGAWDIAAYEYALSQATAPTCTPTSGNAPQSLTCSNSNSAPTVMCAAISPSNPVSNGAGTGCHVGTPLGTGSSEPYSALIGGTYNFIAGTASLADSNETSYTFGNCPTSTQAGVPGIPNYGGLRVDTCTMNIGAIPNVWTSYSTDNGFTGAGLCTTNDAGNVICRVSDGNSDPTLIGGTFTTNYSGSDVDQHISLDGSQFVIGRDGSSNSYLYVYSGIGSPQPVTISGSPYTIPTKIVAFSQSTPKKLYAMNIVQGGPSPVTAVNGSGQYTGTIAAGSSNNLAGDYGITSGFGAGGNITSPTLITASTGTSVSFSVTTTAQSCPGTCTLTVVSQAAISSYNLSACTATSCSPTPTAIYDFAQGTCLNWANGFQPSWSSVWRVSNDDSTFSIAFSNNQGAAGGQNTGTLIATYKVGSGCRVMNSFPASIALTAVNGSGVYSCTCPGAAANLYAYATMTVTGFTNSDNDVTNALITASSATSITISATTTTETASASAAFSVAGIPGSTIVGDYGPTGAVAMTNCGGTPGACSTPDAYAIHDMYQFGNANANYTVGEKCLGGTGCTPGTTTLDQPYAWLIDSLNVLATNSSGHFGVGYDYIMHGTNSPQGQTGLFEVQSGGSLVSSPSSINIVSTTSPDNLPNPGAIILDIHCSWNDNLGIDYYPVECGNTTVAIDMAQTPPHFANNGCDQHGYLQSPPNCLTTNPFTGPLVNELIIYPTAPLGGPVCTSAPCSVLPLLRLGNGYISAVSNDFSAANLIESISPNGAYVLYTTDHMCTLGATSVSITGFTGSSGTLTFTAVNAFSAGNSFALGGFSGANAGLNGQTVTVLSAGLSGTQFEATVTGSGYTGGNGKAINAPPYICGGPLWQSTNNYNAGDVMTPLTANTPNCTYHAQAAGTSGSTQPTWVSSNLCITTPITDGTVTWIYDGMQNMRGDVFMVKTGIANVVIPPNNFLLLGSTYANRLFDGGY